jgi:DNA-binding XRE family transcriptional regulator
MTENGEPREITNLSYQVREAFGWNKKQLAEKTQVNPRTVRRREAWNESEGTWERPIPGEALTLYEIMIVNQRLGLGWLIQEVTSGAFSLDSLKLELKERGGDMTVTLEDILLVLEEATTRVKDLPGLETDHWLANSLIKLEEAQLSLRRAVDIQRKRMSDIEAEKKIDD